MIAINHNSDIPRAAFDDVLLLAVFEAARAARVPVAIVAADEPPAAFDGIGAALALVVDGAGAIDGPESAPGVTAYARRSPAFVVACGASSAPAIHRAAWIAAMTGRASMVVVCEPETAAA